jgi:xylulokinase
MSGSEWVSRFRPVARSRGGSVAPAGTLCPAKVWPIGCDGLTFLPYLSGERAPYLDGDIRGAFHGLSDHHDRGAMTRAVVEGVACSLAEVLRVVAPTLDVGTDRARVSGGLGQSPLIREIVASILGLGLEHSDVDDATSYGAALLAGVVSGGFDDLREAATVPRVTSITQPDGPGAGRYRDLYERFERLHVDAVDESTG